MGELDEPLEVVHRRLASHGALAHEGAAVHRREDHVLTADPYAALGVARLQVELRRRERDLLEHEVRIEEHDLPLDALPCVAQGFERLRMVELDADVGENPAPAALERRDRVVVEDLVSGHPVHEHGASVSHVVSFDQP